jgi:ubiquinone/menaquinone biosynthesis C-methylase UbiE
VSSERAAIASHFDAIAADYYRRNYREPRSRHERGLALRREVCLGLVPSAARCVLDLGSGPGALATPLAQAGRRVVALDLSLQMVRAAVAGGQVAGCVGDAMALPLATASFDAVTCTGVLEYVPDIARALAEIRRVLRSGGMLIATASLPRALEREVARSLGPVVLRLRGRKVDPPIYHRPYTQPQLDALLAAAGLAVTERRFSYFAPFPLDALYPPLVDMFDRRLGPWLARSPRACEHAKTYVVAARAT